MLICTIFIPYAYVYLANILYIYYFISCAYLLTSFLISFAVRFSYYTRTCLSGPATLTPGGVINRLFVMHDPFPQDYRVVIGQRTFEFVEGDPDSEEGITPVPINQLYVHHLSGSVVFGQGTEGVRQT